MAGQSRFSRASAFFGGGILFAGGLVGVSLLNALPAAAQTANAYSCSNVGVTFPASYTYSSDAPATVLPGASYSDSISEASATVPTTDTLAGTLFTVTSYTDIVSTYTAPTGTTISAAASLSGGSGGGTATVSTSGNTVTVTIPGPVAGGASYTAPTVTLPLTVTANPGATIADTFPTIAPTINLADSSGPATTLTATCQPGATPASFDSTFVITTVQSPPVTSTYSCSNLGVTFPASYTFSSDAPATVGSRASYSDSISEASVTVPTAETIAATLFTVTSYTNIVTTYTAPTGTTISGAATLSGGQGGGAATVATSGNTVTVTIPGPVAGGASYTAPTVTLPLTVTANPGATIADTFPTIVPINNLTDSSGTTNAVPATCTPGSTPASFDSTIVITTVQGPVGAIGGLVIAALLGGGLFVVTRVRRNRAVQS